jgi:predicted KAP-like P-loop ATPase
MNTTNSPDEPIRSDAEDLLDRKGFARAISDLIVDAQKGETLRIGVYGAWGEGKTSVLELVQAQLEAAGHVTVFLYAWSYRSTNELLEDLLRKIARKLKIPTRGLSWDKALWFVKIGRQGASLDPLSKAADVVLGQAIETVFGHLFSRLKARAAAALLTAIRQKLGDHKLMVFVDDLDRVRPDVLPELLLTLREVLNQPDFFYILALAPDVVRDGLMSSNVKWGDTTRFLEKIVELPRQLPAPSQVALAHFVSIQV